ncbi:MAG: DUF1998 domain-containing protein [Betaproteobacteria bacterium]
MGLERRFRGSVDHLRIARDVRLAQSEEPPRQYLVVYDSVPGGTGYLKELMRDASPLFEVFRVALNGLQTCLCVADESKDGCYRCLYGYHNSSDRKHVSRRTAVGLLTEILSYQATLQPVSTINEVVARNSLFDSELERRFIEALRRKPPGEGARFEVHEEVVRGKPGYYLQAGPSAWTIEPQVELGPDRGVMILCKPDFVLWPQNVDGVLPVAVFVDGWKYHKERIGDDVAKRFAVARSGKFTVWSLTSDDIAGVLDAGSARSETLWAQALPPTVGGRDPGPTYSSFQIPGMRTFHILPAFDQLRCLLSSQSGITSDDLIRLANVLALRVGARALATPGFDALKGSPANGALEAIGKFAWPEDAELGACWTSEHSQIQVGGQMRRADLQSLPEDPTNRELQPWVVMRWGSAPLIDEAQRRRLWQQWWQASNLMLPLTNCWTTADEIPPLGALDGAPAYRGIKGLTAEWQVAAADAAPEAQSLLHDALTAGVDCPVVGFELLDQTACVVAEAELAWPRRKVALLLTETGHERFEGAGWQVFMLSRRVDIVDLARALG